MEDISADHLVKPKVTRIEKACHTSTRIEKGCHMGTRIEK